MIELIVLLPLVPLAGAVVSGLGRYVRRFPLAQTAALAALAGSLALLVPLAPAAVGGGAPLVYELGGWAEPVGIALYLDGLAWTISLVGLLVALCALVFAVCEGRHAPRFYFFFLVLVFGMEGVILTGDLFNLFVFLEILSIASYILIADTDRPRALLASFRYLMISSLGIAFFLLGIFLFYQATGTLSLRLLAEAVRAMREAGAGCAPPVGSFGPRTLELAVVCLAVGAGVKAAFVPLHTWLPDAHAWAPHPVSAVLSGVMIKVSFLVVWRLLALFAASDLQEVLLWVGGVTAVFGVGAAVAQTDCKRLLAFHSVSQMGYIVAAFGAGSAAALGASLYHLVNHSLFKSLLFLTIGGVIHATGERDINRLRNLGALAGRLPGLFVLFLAGALSIAGLPPFNGYASKGLITAGLQNRPAAYILILLAGAGTVASFLKLSGIFWAPRSRVSRSVAPGRDAIRLPGGASGAPVRKVPPAMLLPMALLALLCLATGLFPEAMSSILGRVALGRAALGGAGWGVFALGGAAAGGMLPRCPLYSLRHLLELAGTVAVGVGLYLLATQTRAGDRLLARLRGLRSGLNSALALLVLALTSLVLMTWLL